MTNLSVLTCTQQALQSIGHVPPTTLISPTDKQQLKLVALIKEQSRELRNARVFPQQKKTYTLALTSGRTEYPLPSDFYSGLLGTPRDRTTRWSLVGPLSDATWNYRLYGPGATNSRAAYRVFGPDMNSNTSGGQLKINAPTGSTDTLSFDYVSRNLFLPPDWTPSELGITVGKWRNLNGHNYKCTAITTGQTASGPFLTTDADAYGETIVDNGVTWTNFDGLYEVFVVDEDMSIFDDDLMIEGIKWRYLKSLGLPFEDFAASHAHMVERAVSRWKGSYIGRMDGERTRGYFVQEGGWTF